MKKAQIGKLLILVKELENKKLLKTTKQGFFYIYPELFKMSNSENLAKNIFTYGAACKLLDVNQTLYFRDPDTEKLFAQYCLKNGFIKIV